MVCFVANHYTARAFYGLGISILGSGLWERMADLIKQAGGDVLVGAAAQKILVSRNRVTGCQLRYQQQSNKLPRSKLSRLQLDFATRSGVLIRAILLKQCQLIVAMEFLIRPSLTFDVVTYHCFISMFPYSTCKISITPKLPSPEPLFYMRTSAEYLVGGHTPLFGTSPEKPGDTSIPLHYDSCEYTHSSPYNNAASCGE